MEIEKTKLIRKSNPYSYFYIDNFLEQSEYQNLISNYPDSKYFRYLNQKTDPKVPQNRDGKQIFDSNAIKLWNEFLSEPNYSCWENFLNTLSSDKFLNHLRDIFYEELKKDHPEIADKKWSFLKKEKHDEINNDVQIMEKPYIQFTRMEDQSFVDPHKDEYRKIIVLIFYFPSECWKPSLSKSNGTNINKVYYPESGVDFRNLNYKNSKFTKIVDAIDYIPNRMMGFIKNNKSFHSVGPLNWPKNEYRDALLFNISGVNYKPKGQKKEKIYKSLLPWGKLMQKFAISK